MSDLIKFHNDNDNLKSHPKKRTSSYSILVIGDLHGNALKLLHFLLKWSIVYWPKNEQNLYQDFYQAYYITPPHNN